MKRSKYNMASFLIVLFYLAMSDFFGIVDFSLLFPGEMYDYVIALTFVLAILIFFKSRCIVKITNIHFEFWPFLGVIMIAVIQAILMQTQRQQSFSESFSANPLCPPPCLCSHQSPRKPRFPQSPENRRFSARHARPTPSRSGSPKNTPQITELHRYAV